MHSWTDCTYAFEYYVQIHYYLRAILTSYFKGYIAGGYEHSNLFVHVCLSVHL